MAAPLYRKRQLAAKVESTPGSAEALTNADAGILVEDVRFNPNIESLDRNVLHDSLSNWDSVPGPRIATLTFRAEVAGSGATSTAPAMGKYLRACGFTETLQTEGVLYALTSTEASIPTLTMGMYNENVRWLLYGARGNVSFEAAANRIAYANFTFTGIYSEFAALTALTGITYQETVPGVFRNASCTFNFGTSYTTGVFANWTLDMGNTVSLRENANASSGFSYARITARKPTGTFDLDIPSPDLTTEQSVTPNLMTALVTPTTGTLAMVVGSGTGNRMAVAAPAVQVVAVTDADRDGVSTHDFTYNLVLGSTDDDELTLTFY